MKTSRGDTGLRTSDIVKVLEQAGWSARQGRGDHVVLSKNGQRNIVLAQRISMAQWKNIEQSVGIEVETLLNKRLKGRGKGLTPEELTKRFTLAYGLHKAGLPVNYVVRHTGLINPGTLPGFTPKLFDTVGLEGVIQQYVKPREIVAEAVPEVEAAVEAEIVQAEIVAADSAVDTILDLMTEVVTDVRQIIGQRQRRNRNFLNAIRRLSALRQHIDDECEALLNEMEAAWNEEAGEGGA